MLKKTFALIIIFNLLSVYFSTLLLISFATDKTNQIILENVIYTLDDLTKEAYVVGLVNKEIEKVDIVKYINDYKVTKIQEESFKDCESLKDINIPNGINEIGKDAFKNCYNLTSLIIPNTIKIVGNSSYNKGAFERSWNKKNYN